MIIYLCFFNGERTRQSNVERAMSRAHTLHADGSLAGGWLALFTCQGARTLEILLQCVCRPERETEFELFQWRRVSLTGAATTAREFGSGQSVLGWYDVSQGRNQAKQNRSLSHSETTNSASMIYSSLSLSPSFSRVGLSGSLNHQHELSMRLPRGRHAKERERRTRLRDRAAPSSESAHAFVGPFDLRLPARTLSMQANDSMLRKHLWLAPLAGSACLAIFIQRRSPL